MNLEQLNLELLYSLTGVILFALGLFGLLCVAHVIRKLIALNLMGIGVFMLALATAYYSEITDPVPHAMVLTGIVVAIAGTALCLWLAVRVHTLTPTDMAASKQ